MGKFCVEVMNDNGERLCDFCGMNEPDVLVNGCMRTSILDTRVTREQRYKVTTTW